MRAEFYLVYVLWLALGLCVMGEMSPHNISPDTNRIETTRLPYLRGGQTIDWKKMPYVGNGHLATVVYNGSLYLNGLYNGEGGESHRARIPNDLNFQIEFLNGGNNIFRRYSLNMKYGYWEENITADEAHICHRVYAHQYFNRLLVVDLFIQRPKRVTGNLNLRLVRPETYPSADIKFRPKHDFDGGNWQQQGEIKTPEQKGQSQTRVYKYWTHVSNEILVNARDKSKFYTFLVAVDTVKAIAQESFSSAVRMATSDHASFFDLHKTEWKKQWDRGRIELVGNPALETLAYSSLYYILSSLPSYNSDRVLAQFYGVSPSGLAVGGESGSRDPGSDGYNGHVFWDMDLWILPALLLFHPQQARGMLDYRVNQRRAAYDYASSMQSEGLRYPWETAFTGNDVTPACCAQDAEHNLHVTADVAFAARLYMSATLDIEWFSASYGFDLVRDIAKFWKSQAIGDPKTGRYSIKDVNPLDPIRKRVSNSVFTNAAASLSIFFARYIACLSGKLEEVPDDWVHVAQNLYLPYNTTLHYHEPYEGFNELVGVERRVKHVDVALLGFPLMWPMSSELRKRNLDVYSKLYESTESPPIPSAMLSIGYLEINDPYTADSYFVQSYERYVSKPFNVWSERPDGEGAPHYLTGQAAFLQTLQYGYCGIRIHPDRMDLNPQLPQGVTSMRLYNLDYLRTQFTLKIYEKQVNLEVEALGEHHLQVMVNNSGQTFTLLRAQFLTFERGPFSIFASKKAPCEPPKDTVNNEYVAVSSPLNSAQRILPNSPVTWSTLTLSLLACFTVFSMSFN